jgi:hypothetical protein
MISILSALHVADLVTSDLIDHTYGPLARLTRNSRYTEARIRARLAELGIARATRPPSVEESGTKIYFSQGQAACWLSVQVWNEGKPTTVHLELSIVHDDSRSETITLEAIGHHAEPAISYTAVPKSEIAQELKRQQDAAQNEAAIAKQKMEELRLQSAT